MLSLRAARVAQLARNSRPLRGRVLATSSAPRTAAKVEQYATPLQWTHWAMAAGILGSYGLVELSKRAPELKGTLMDWHAQIGLLLLGGLGARVGLRMSNPTPPHLPAPRFQRLAAQGVHAAMYPLMAALPLTGIVMLYYGGKGLSLGPLHLPGADAKDDKEREADQATAKQNASWHSDLGSVLEVLVPLHIAATGLHVAAGKNPLARMAPLTMRNAMDEAVRAVRTRPGSVMGGGALAAAGSAWLAFVAWDKLKATAGGGAMVAVDAAQQGRVITLDELEQHNKEDDLWIAVDGKVYDMTKYHKVHPGFGGPAVTMLFL